MPEKINIKTEKPGIKEKSEGKLWTWVEMRLKDLKPEDFSSDFASSEELKNHFDTFSTGEKVSKLYDLLSSYFKLDNPSSKKVDEGETDKDAEKVKKEILSYAKILWNDEKAQEGLLEVFSKGTVERKFLRDSSIGSQYEKLNRGKEEIEKKYEGLNQKVWLQKINPILLPKSKTDLGFLANKLIEKRDDQEDLVKLTKSESTPENADAVAQIQHKKLLEYQNQLREGFVWLPSRLEIQQKIVEQLQNGRWPILMGEAGTGKSEQADAAAKMLTGENPTHVACTDRTGEKELIAKTDIDTLGSYELYGAATQAFTGYENSRQTEPVFKNGRIIRLDEINRMSGQSPGYALIKELRQLRSGTFFHGKKVLPGFGAIGTGNPEGSRYEDRYQMDAAMQREFANIIVDYPPMSHDDPELYEFILSALMDEKGFVNVAKGEVSPYYKDSEERKGETLPDGRIIEGTEVVEENSTDKKHGYIYRLAFAIKSVQDSFVHYQDENDFPGALKYSLQDGKIVIDPNGSNKLTLSKATITLYDISSWMKGFRERMGKDSPDYQTKNISAFIKYKIESYIDGLSDVEDQKKVRAIFEHYHLLDDDGAIFEKPLTPQEIGYLSPRVPRPLKLKDLDKVEQEGEFENEGGGELPDTDFEGEEVMLENGERVKIDKKSITIAHQGKEKKINSGARFILDGENVMFLGTLLGDENKIVLQKNLGEGNITNIMVGIEELERIEIKPQFISEADPKNEKIELDFEKIKEYWVGFYARYGIDASYINKVYLTSESIEDAQEIIKKYEFDHIAIIPDLSPQDIIDNQGFVTFNDPGSPDDQKTGANGPIWINDTIKSSSKIKQKPTKFKVVFLKNKNVKEGQSAVDGEMDHTIQKIQKDIPALLNGKKDTRGQTYAQIKAMEEYMGLEGLDEVTAMVLDREHYDKTGIHLFEWQKDNAVWLTKTIDKYETGRCANFDWDSSSSDRQWDVRLWRATNANDVLGSVFSRSLEYEEID